MNIQLDYLKNKAEQMQRNCFSCPAILSRCLILT